MAGEIRTVPGTRLLSVSRAVLTGDAVLGRNDAPYQFFDAGAANRNVTLPAAEKGLAFVIKNFGAANNIVVKDAAAVTLATLTPHGLHDRRVRRHVLAGDVRTGRTREDMYSQPACVEVRTLRLLARDLEQAE